MKTINEIFRAFGHEYIRRFGDDMPREHIKVIGAIIGCRTGERAPLITSASNAVFSTPFIAPAATVIAPHASITRPASGWKPT